MKKLILLIILFPLLSFGTVYYMDATDGSNGNTGLSPAQAWQTIAYLQTQSLSPDDSVLFQRSEEWRETYTVQYSGTSGNPIFHGAYGTGNKPIFNGANLVNIWIDMGGGKYYNLGISTEPRVIGINGVAATMVANSSLVDSQGEAFWTTSGSDTIFIFTSIASDTNNIEAATREDGFNDGDEDYIIFDNTEVRFVTGEAIDIGGNNNIVSNCTVYGAGRKGIVVWSGTDVNINNNNLQGHTEFIGSAGIQTFTGPINLYSNMIKHFQLGIHINNAGSAYGGNVYSNTIDSCDVGDIDEADGIKVSGTDDDYNGLIISTNMIRGFRENGIDNNGTGNVIMEFNEISDPLQASSDNVYGIKCGGASSLPNMVRYNYIHDLNSDGTLGVGIYVLTNFDSIIYNIFANLDTDGINILTADNVFVANNSVYGVGGWGIRGSDTAEDLIFRNNIVDGVAGKEINLGAGSSASGGTNIMATDAAVTGAGTYTGTGDFGTTDPLWTDPVNSDFTLRNFSPAVDRGIGVGLTTDYATTTILDVTPTVSGDSVDIGAYELAARLTSLYVSNTGSNDSTGVSTSNPIATVAHLQTCYLVPGDNVYYNKGDEWREQYTVQYTGTSGNVMTVGSYGSGADPIINGADLVSTWTAANVWTTIWDAEEQSGDSSWANQANSEARNYRIHIKNSSISSDATVIRLGFNSSAIGDTLNDVAIGLKKASSDAYDFDATPTNVQKNGLDSLVLAAGLTITTFSDSFSFNIDNTKDYLVSVYFSNPNSAVGMLDSGADELFYKGIAADESEIEDVTGYSGLAKIRTISFIQEFAPSLLIFSKSLTWDQGIVIEDGSPLGFIEFDTDTEITFALMSAGTFSYNPADSICYIWCSDSLDPDTHTIEVGTRLYSVYGTGKNYITISNITTEGASAYGIYDKNGDNWIVDNCTIRYNGGVYTTFYFGNGIQLDGDGNNNTFTNNTIYEIFDSGISPQLWAVDETITNTTILGNTIYNCGFAGIEIASQANSDTITTTDIDSCIIYGSGKGWSGDRNEHGIFIYTSDVTDPSISGTTIDGCTIYDNESDGINIYQDAGVITAQRNSIYSNGRYGISIGDDEALATTGLFLNYNLIHSNTNKGVFYDVPKDTVGGGIIWKNNIFYGNGDKNVHIFQHGVGEEIIKNNIFYSTNIQAFWDDDGMDAGASVDYNLFYKASGDIIYYNGTSYDASEWAAYKAASGQDTNSPAPQDPLFTDAANNDFTLTAKSPAIDAGTSVGLVEDKDGNTVPFGSAVDIGAYEYSEDEEKGFETFLRFNVFLK